jgi:hypothetical protein
MPEIISVIIGGALAICGGWATQFWQYHRERRALAHALGGEIYAIVEIVERRRYAQGISDLIGQAAQKNEPLALHAPVTQNYFVVYESNAAKIGMLPREVARDIAVFYGFTKSVIEDFGLRQFPPATVTDAIARLSETGALLTEMIKLGRKVVPELEKI